MFISLLSHNIPKNRNLIHICDSPECINTSHLLRKIWLVFWFLIPTLCVFHICEPSFEVGFLELLRYATFVARWQKGQSLFVHRHKIHFMSCSRRIFQVITGHNTSAYQIWAAHKKGCQLGLSDVSIVTCNFQCRCHRFAQSASSMRWDSLLHTCSRSSTWLTKWISTTEHLGQSSLSLTSWSQKCWTLSSFKWQQCNFYDLTSLDPHYAQCILSHKVMNMTSDVYKSITQHLKHNIAFVILSGWVLSNPYHNYLTNLNVTKAKYQKKDSNLSNKNVHDSIFWTDILHALALLDPTCS